MALVRKIFAMLHVRHHSFSPPVSGNLILFHSPPPYHYRLYLILEQSPLSMGSDLEELRVELVDLFGESDWVVEYDVFGDAAVVMRLWWWILAGANGHGC